MVALRRPVHARGRRPAARGAARGPGLLARRARGRRARRREPGPQPRDRCGCATTFPTNSRPSRPRLRSPCRAAARRCSPTDSCPRRRGTYVFEQVDALVASRLGFWRGQYIVAAPHRGAGLSRHSPGRAVHDAGAARPAELDRGAPVAPAGHRQRVRAAARLHRRGRPAPHRLAGLGPAQQADVAGHFSRTRASESSS